MTPPDSTTRLATQAGPKPVPTAKPTPARPRPRFVLRIDPYHETRTLFSWLIIAGWVVSLILHLTLVIYLMCVYVDQKGEEKASFEGGMVDTTQLPPERLKGLQDSLLKVPDPQPENIPPLSAPTIAQPNLDLSKTAPIAKVVTRPAAEKAEEKGDAKAFGETKFGEGKEKIQGIDVKVGDPQFTLIWDSDADLDLHVEEPGGSHLHWGNRKGSQGGELDVDDTNGYGPENIFWNASKTENGTLNPGNGPPGQYRWKVKYYMGFNNESRRTRWKVRVKHQNKIEVFEGVLSRIGQESKIATLEIEQ